MAHTFKNIPAKSTFDALQREFYQSDYINRKKNLYVVIIFYLLIKVI